MTQELLCLPRLDFVIGSDLFFDTASKSIIYFFS